MKSFRNLLCLLLPLLSLRAAEKSAIQSALLDDRVIYTVPVSSNRVTTISFPGPISAIDAAGVTTDAKIAGQFQLAHTRGSAFLSVRAVVSRASCNVNVRFNKQTYVFEFVESENPVLSFILEAKPIVPTVEPAPKLAPSRLLALLDKAKAFPLLKRHHPEVVSQAEFITYTPEKPRVADFNDYEARIEEVYRFNPEDTLVFRVTLRNKTDFPIHYRPDSFSIRVGQRVYPQSISDASGLILPKDDSTVYFAVTGTPDGGRNELSLKNQFTVVLERLPSTTRTNAVPTLPASPHK